MTRPTITAAAVLAFGLIFSACTPLQQPAAPAEDSSSLPAQVDSTTELASAMQRVSAQGNYQSPAQPEHVAFELVLDAEGVIVEANSTVTSDNPTSQMRQTAFAEAFPDAVVGKKLADLENVDRIGGSSLTTGAFNAALAELKSQL